MWMSHRERPTHTTSSWIPSPLPARHQSSLAAPRRRTEIRVTRGHVFMWRKLILAAGLFACLIPAGTFAQDDRKTVTVEVYLPEGARLFIEGQEMTFRGPMRRFVSPPLPPGKYTYTVKAIVCSPYGPRTITQPIDVRPGDF